MWLDSEGSADWKTSMHSRDRRVSGRDNADNTNWSEMEVDLSFTFLQQVMRKKSDMILWT
ncbi:unnamed protein product [Linum tenue]|uniref:Uncharacterized protein n=1 Tax=Linum tenue TaxID=586396 RepID=A0AAV0PH56_9ROSI|nr:unnamed protein product [Linum tenue]